MNGKILVAAFAGLALATGFAAGRIGESPAQCQERYGKPLDITSSGRRAEYTVGGVGVTCWFRGDVCGAVIYRVEAPIGANSNPRLTRGQSFALLKLNAPGAQWKQVARETASEPWVGHYETADGLLRADLSYGTVDIFRAAAAKLSADEAAEAAIDKSVAAICRKDGAGAPEPVYGGLPPTDEDIEREAFRKQLDEMKQRGEEAERTTNEAFREAAEILKKLEEGK